MNKSTRPTRELRRPYPDPEQTDWSIAGHQDLSFNQG